VQRRKHLSSSECVIFQVYLVLYLMELHKPTKAYITAAFHFSGKLNLHTDNDICLAPILTKPGLRAMDSELYQRHEIGTTECCYNTPRNKQVHIPLPRDHWRTKQNWEGGRSVLNNHTFVTLKPGQRRSRPNGIQQRTVVPKPLRKW